MGEQALCLVILLLRSLFRSLGFILELGPPRLHGEPQALGGTLKRHREAKTGALQHVHHLGTQSIAATLDAAEPLDAVEVKDTVLDAATHQQKLLHTTAGDGLVVAGGCPPGRRREGRRAGGQRAQDGGDVIRRHGGEGHKGNRSDQERSNLLIVVVLLHAGSLGSRDLRVEELNHLKGLIENTCPDDLKLNVLDDIDGRRYTLGGRRDRHFGEGGP
ncbi:hypothetical protein PspLS_02162 [Pyricularia sp. CBS 133598]|nr:hypothetical protein PspLS_02162 [Pyricularia sp. CBS 133598]